MKKIKMIRILLVFAVFLLASSFYYLPYYISKPGMAKELEPIIEVEDGYEEEGKFMLTTVRMGRANIYSYLSAKLIDYREIYPIEYVRGENETDEEYNIRQLHLMNSSKIAAIEVAYKKAGIPVDFKYNGVYVLHVVPDMPAEGKLEAADRIFQIDGKEFHSSEEFIKYVSSLKAGEQIKLTYERNNEINHVNIQAEAFKDDENKERIGIGIGLVDDKELIVKPNVKVKTDEIGGPSAGFMFSLEIYNQLTESDLTKGYEIAGTGTISPDGTVGKIGGIEQKVIAADNAGADIFLAPNENGAKDSNYQAAVRTAEDIGTEMKIIPVDTFDDAITYLENLQPKK
ncbi:SepM family pheromone-processing serine protease [Niallia endozanthoxylica]|uniref:endopeptidase La n=1 Tax=Niallia endozanthoxylica TaxID=2036016 RepID=A0A5J5HY18_9BACI|nr:SepM family pheromone-processing serine protease [Niallia endozanthoxylica]KAA9025984.1 PDZ domain-containing protein [Niallia endozanthoxylica]